MKKLLIFISLFICLRCFSQEDTNRYFKNVMQYGQQIPRVWGAKLLRIPLRDEAEIPSKPGALSTDGHNKLYIWDGASWNETTNTTIILDSTGNVIRQDTLLAGPFSSVPTIGFNPGTNLTPAQIMQAAFYNSQAPAASLTGGQIIELMETGEDLSFTLNWTAGRNFATQPIASIVVAGTTEDFSQPDVNASVSGTEAVSVTRNVNTTFSIAVTTEDSKTAAASTSFVFEGRRYAGWSASSSPSDATILGSSNIREFATNNDKVWTQPAPGTPSRFFYAYPSSFGDLQHFNINGFESIGSLTLTKRDFTNASGYTQQYNIYVSNNNLSYGLTIDAK